MNITEREETSENEFYIRDKLRSLPKKKATHQKHSLDPISDTDPNLEWRQFGSNALFKVYESKKKKNNLQLYNFYQFLLEDDTLLIKSIRKLIIILAFYILVNAGHTYCLLLVLLLNILIFHEIMSLKKIREQDLQIPLFSVLNWYFFATGVFFFYGKVVQCQHTQYILTRKIINQIIIYHNLICFILWIIGFLVFILSLRKGFFRYQFRQFGWTHISIFLLVGQSSAIILNIYQGLIWFVLPCFLVFSNDYFLTLFTHKGTKENYLLSYKSYIGFVFSMAFTIFFGVLIGDYFSQFQFLICPYSDILFKSIEQNKCEQHQNLYQKYQINFPQMLYLFSNELSFEISNFQIHTIVLSIFASLIAPFRGFFASSFKKAIKFQPNIQISKKQSLGLADRMDCYILMGMFQYLYLQQIILGGLKYSSSILQYIATLSDKEKLLIYEQLGKILVNKEIIKEHQILNKTLTL